jgi:CheY-like chemotaxis protein
MERAEPPSARLLVVARDPSRREALLALLAEEGYVPSGVSSREEALAALEQQSYALLLADLVAGMSKHALSPAHILRRRAHPTPLGLLTAPAPVLEQAHLDGFAFALPQPIEPPVLLTEVAACLNYPLSGPQQQQAETVRRFLEAWGLQAWRELLSLYTEEVACYSASPLPGATGRPFQGKLALLALLSQVRRRSQRLRIEAQGVYPRPHGLAVRYTGCVAEFGKSWEWVSGVALFAFAGERICQIGRPWSSLLEVPTAGSGWERSS